MPVRHPSGAVSRWLAMEERSLPEMRLRQIQHLDGFKAIRLDEVPTRVCRTGGERGSGTIPGAQQWLQ